MRTHLLYREHPATMPTRTWRGAVREFLHGYVWPALGVALVFLLFCGAGYLDERSRMQDTALQLQREADLLRSFDAGRQLGHQEMVDSTEAAWQAANTEAQRCAARRGL